MKTSQETHQHFIYGHWMCQAKLIAHSNNLLKSYMENL